MFRHEPPEHRRDCKGSSGHPGKRPDGIVLRAVPMRVASRDTSEEADARARAMTELSRIGGFSTESLQEDFRLMSVQAADNIPFYETLAPFVAPDPEFDVLTSHYRRMGKQFLGQDLAIPSFDSAWVEQVRYRLQPRNATVDYLTKLKSAEPARAVAELARLIGSAHETAMESGGLEDDYVSSLVETVFAIESDLDDSLNTDELRIQAIDLLRTMFISNSKKWRELFALTIEEYLEEALFLPEEVEIFFLDELDSLFENSSIVRNMIRKLGYRRRVARICLNNSDAKTAIWRIGMISDLISKISSQNSNLTTQQQEKILAAQVDTSLLRGEFFQTHGQLDKAVLEFKEGLQYLLKCKFRYRRSELRLQLYDTYLKLAKMDPNQISRLEQPNMPCKPRYGVVDMTACDSNISH